MFEVANGPGRDLPDVHRFIEMVRAFTEHPEPAVRVLFEPDREVVISRAPGRLDIMGGIADYSGSLVLQLPIAGATMAAVQRCRERVVRIVSLGQPPEEHLRSFEMPLAAFETGEVSSYGAARTYLRGDESRSWAGYAAGAILVLMRERDVKFEDGVRILIASDVPEGKGVASSGALEVAVMHAVASAFELELEPVDLALLCQKVENHVVGAPCGVMDQMTAVRGRKGRLLALLCQPAKVKGLVPVPEKTSFWGIDSGIRHAVSGSDYTGVRAGAFMGYRIIAELAGLKVQQTDQAQTVQVKDDVWHGYLANITPDEFNERFWDHLPETLTGAEFLDRYGGTTDPFTHIEPDRTYNVLIPTTHPVYENSNVKAFADLLRQRPEERTFVEMGELMYHSHNSYSSCGLGCAGTDLIVDLVRGAGASAGLYGARITGGGSGGTVVVLGRADAGDAVSQVAQEYAELTGRAPVVISGSSDGASVFGLARLRPKAVE